MSTKGCIVIFFFFFITSPGGLSTKPSHVVRCTAPLEYEDNRTRTLGGAGASSYGSRQRVAVLGYFVECREEPPERALRVDKTDRWLARITAGLGGAERAWARTVVVLAAARARHLVVRVIAVAQHLVDVLHAAELLEERNQIEELRVCHVVEPWSYWHLCAILFYFFYQICLGKIFSSNYCTVYVD